MLLSSLKALTALGCAFQVSAIPSGRHSALASKHHTRDVSYREHPERAKVVMEAFSRGWDGYYTYAFPGDSLLPISKGRMNDRNGWGASAVDALSTAIVMGNKTVVNQILNYVPEINFSVAEGPVSLFETTIRYLGGLLSAHDILTSAHGRELVDEPNTLIQPLLDQAIKLADNLKPAFNTSTGIPFNNLIFSPPGAPTSAGDTTNSLATIGTLVLEWTRLSDKTGNDEYAKLSQKAQSYLLNPRPRSIGEPFPGLLGTNVAISNGSFVDSSGSWGGGDDSFYEYLIKMFVYDKQRFGEYKDRWIAAADSSIKYIASHPTSRPDLTFLAGWIDSQTLSYRSGHLACFYGGNFILGGLTLERQDYIDFGEELVAGCRQTYTKTKTHIGPEIFAWQDDKVSPMASNNRGPPVAQAAFYEENGFWIALEDYVLRPEVIESYYYAYRATGDTKYQDWAWEAFVAINKTCSAGVGFSGVKNVNAVAGGGFDDFQESFWFAEVLKYSYLIQADQSAPWQISAEGNDEFVFNTEAHPFKVAGGNKR